MTIKPLYPFMIFMSIATTTLVSSASTITTIDDIPQFCAELLAKLDEGPLFPGLGTNAQRAKIITVDSFAVASICALLNKNSENIVGKFSHWSLRAFSVGNFHVYLDDQDLGNGLELSLFDSDDRCSLSLLSEAFDVVIGTIKNGWRAASAKDYENVFFEKDQNDFSLFVKDSSLYEEDTLIRFMTRALELEYSVECYCYWKSNDSFEATNTIYLWRKNSAFAHVNAKLVFDF